MTTAATAPTYAEQASELWSQADSYYDAAAMKDARQDVLKEHGGQTAYFVYGDRLEFLTGEGNPSLIFNGQAWWGGDRNKLWLKTETEYSFEDKSFEDAEIQALWSRAISRYFDFQAGIRHDFSQGPSRTYGVVGVQGLAPYWFETGAAFFVSDNGDVSARIEAEYDLKLTQRLVIQPSLEADISFQDIPSLATGSGISTVELGVRLRYEIKREFAPYIGAQWNRSLGDTAAYSRAKGDDPEKLSFVAGIRFWF
jgi:copper resistance protein B